MPSPTSYTSLLTLLCIFTNGAAPGSATEAATPWTPSFNGTIAQSQGEVPTDLSILVVSSDGQIIECVPVLPASTFNLQVLPSRLGLHILYVTGSTTYDYDAIVTNVTSGKLTATYTRSDPLALPSDTNFPNESLELHFSPKRKATFRVDKSSRIRFPNLWRYKQHMLVALAVAFILWFPSVYQKLPKETREELTGEVEPDLGDPNRVIKALLGDDSGMRSHPSASGVTSASR